MPSERMIIERVAPDRYHVEIDYGPPSYTHRIVDVATLATAIAEITAAAAVIEPVGTVVVSDEKSPTFAADTAPAAATPTEVATPRGDA